MSKKYIVRLTQGERDRLIRLVSTGKAAVYKIKHTNILLKSGVNGSNWPATHMAFAFSCAQQTVYNIRQRFVTQGLGYGIGTQTPNVPPCAIILDSEGQTHL